MSVNYLITQATICNEGETFSGDLRIRDGLIAGICRRGAGQPDSRLYPDEQRIDAFGLLLIPGIIDGHVHFREPGLTHKADLYTESKAALAGGVTSFMEMPNTIPNALTEAILEQKFSLAAEKSLANYSFYLGASNANLEEILAADMKRICGIKLFLGSSTGNMLVDDPEVLEKIFSRPGLFLAAHCEDEAIIRQNAARYKEVYGEEIPVSAHPLIRSEEACYTSSAAAVLLARRFNSRLHLLHVSTGRELDLLDAALPLAEKRITAEATVHHLTFDDRDYELLGSRIKMNPAIKTPGDRQALFNGLMDNKIDVISTDHAPHTAEEKDKPGLLAPSGAPMVQHSLAVMLEYCHLDRINIETVVNKMCHAPAICHNVSGRGFLREGYHADLVLADLNRPWTVEASNILYKCGWSPLEGRTFTSKVLYTFVNGNLAYDHGRFDEETKGQRLEFER